MVCPVRENQRFAKKTTEITQEELLQDASIFQCSRLCRRNRILEWKLKAGD
jgi:hypothetical protein